MSSAKFSRTLTLFSRVCVPHCPPNVSFPLYRASRSHESSRLLIQGWLTPAVRLEVDTKLPEVGRCDPCRQYDRMRLDPSTALDCCRYTALTVLYSGVVVLHLRLYRSESNFGNPSVMFENFVRSDRFVAPVPGSKLQIEHLFIVPVLGWADYLKMILMDTLCRVPEKGIR